jgi:hypothetical protein
MMYRFKFIVSDLYNLDDHRLQLDRGLSRIIDCALISLAVVHSPELYLSVPDWHSLYHALSDEDEKQLFTQGTTTDDLLDILKMRKIEAVLDNKEVIRKRP